MPWKQLAFARAGIDDELLPREGVAGAAHEHQPGFRRLASAPSSRSRPVRDERRLRGCDDERLAPRRVLQGVCGHPRAGARRMRHLPARGRDDPPSRHAHGELSRDGFAPGTPRRAFRARPDVCRESLRLRRGIFIRPGRGDDLNRLQRHVQASGRKRAVRLSGADCDVRHPPRLLRPRVPAGFAIPPRGVDHGRLAAHRLLVRPRGGLRRRARRLRPRPADALRRRFGRTSRRNARRLGVRAGRRMGHVPRRNQRRLAQVGAARLSAGHRRQDRRA